MLKLSTRSYLVLGLLAIDDWTTYELARQMERGFGDIWPSSRSMVYEEPKALVAAGLARARIERIGERSRTRYGITPSGRTALKRWLAEPGAAPAMHFEGLLKVLLARSRRQREPGPLAHGGQGVGDRHARNRAQGCLRLRGGERAVPGPHRPGLGVLRLPLGLCESR